MTVTVTSWWHIFSVHDSETDLYVVMTVGPSTYAAEDVPNGETRPGGDTHNAGLAIRDRKFALPQDLTSQHATYRTSFDHEPTEQDMDNLAPVGHRSWEQE